MMATYISELEARQLSYQRKLTKDLQNLSAVLFRAIETVERGSDVTLRELSNAMARCLETNRIWGATKAAVRQEEAELR